MKKKRRIVMILAIPLVGLMLASGLSGCGHRQGRESRIFHENPAKAEEHVKRHMDRLLEEVEATDQQKQAASESIDSLLPLLRSLAQQRNSFRDELRSELSKNDPDTGSLHASIDDQTAALNRTGHALVNAAVEIHRVLTPEQREILIEKWEQKGKRRWRR